MNHESVPGPGDPAACGVCGGSEFRMACRMEGATYVCCASCGVTRQFPYPADSVIRQYYEDYPGRKASDSDYLSAAGEEAYRRDKLLTLGDLGFDTDRFRAKRICDVGCATGQFLRLAASYSPAGHLGLDLSADCVRMAIASGINAQETDFLQVEEAFDIVTMWHVIEHLVKPATFVEKAFSVLEPGGSLLVETPVTGLVSRGFAGLWRFYLPIEHLNLFSQTSLVRLCLQAGFELRAWTRFGSGNTSGTVPAANKRAMDGLVKELGCGDTMAAWFTKPAHAARTGVRV